MYYLVSLVEKKNSFFFLLDVLKYKGKSEKGR